MRPALTGLSRPRAAVAWVAALGCALTVAAAFWQHCANAQFAAERFRDESQVGVDRLVERLRTFESGLIGARGLVAANGPDALEADRFARYSRSRNIPEEFPGAGAVAVVWKVAAADAAAFVAARHAAGVRDFALKPLASAGEVRFVIGLVEPLAPHLGWRGFDLASVAAPREAAEAAMRSGGARLSAPFAVPASTGAGNLGLLLLLPMYRNDAPTATEAERVAASIGWTALPLVPDRLLAGIAGDGARIDMAVHDRDDPARTQLFATPASLTPADVGRPPSADPPGLVRTVELPVYGRTWLVDLRARPEFVAALRQTSPAGSVVFGALLTLLAAGVAHRLAAAAQRASRVGDDHARLAALVDSRGDAHVGETLDGIVTDWNAGAERLFGHAAANAIGRSLADLLVPEDRAVEHARLRAAVARGTAVPAFDTQRRHRDGTLLDVSVAASPIVAADGRIVGFATTVRDTGQARQAEREARESSSRLEQRVAERTALLETARHDLQTILDAMPTLIGYWDRDLRHRFTNRAAHEWFGRDARQLQGMRLPDLLGPELFALDEPLLRAALRGEARTFERTLAHPDGQRRRDALVDFLPDVIDGEVRGLYILAHDVSEVTSGRRRLAAAVRENEALLGTIHLHAIVSVADPAGRIVDANEGFCRISGYRRDELVGQDHRIVNSGTHDRAFWNAMWGRIASGQPWRGVICNRAKDGSLYWVDSMVAPFVGADGRVEKYISIRFDVTPAKRAEQALRASEAFLDRAGEIARIGGWELDLRTMALTWSKQTCRIHDLPPDHRPDLARAIDFYAPEARPLVEQAVHRAMVDGSPWDLEMPLITATGRRIWVRSQGTTDFEAGKPIRLIGAFQDITERKQAAVLLQRADERFAIAAASARIGVWDYDPRAGTLEWDEHMYVLYGRQPHPGVEEPYALWASSVHPDDQGPVVAALEAALRGERDFDPEFRITCPNGDMRHLKASAKVSRDASGAPVRMIGLNIDITERKRAEIELVATSQLLGTVLESASEVAIIAGDCDLNITVFNAGAQRLLGYSADEIIGRTTPVLLHDIEEVQRRADELSAELGRRVEGGQVFTEASTLSVPREWTYVRKDGSRVRVSLVITAMHAADGSLRGYLGIAHDITRQREHEASLRQAMHRANQASQAKSQFLANISHEIRTPMNAVIGLTYLLGQSPLDTAQADTLDKLRIAAKSLLGLINDVLDLSQIEAGELSLERAPFSLPTLLRELSAMMSVQAQSRRIGFSIDTASDLPEALLGDASRLGHVLTNLVANAIKFTDEGGVRLAVRRIGGDASTVRLRFDVEDSGIGIAPDVQARLFSPFVQADASTRRRYGGTGLGLSIVKRIVTLMGGEVHLHSAPGEGSTFSVELEFDVADAAALPTPAARGARHEPALRGVRVLVADDSDINLEVARRILELEGAQVTSASNGQEAVDLLRARPDAFDAVLMDVQMPVLDGHEATRRIRDELGLVQLPVIALTAGALTREHQRAEAAGMDDFISKPFDVQGLVRTLLRHVRPTAAPGPSREPADDLQQRTGPWPEVEGIDTDAVRGRLRGDVALFRSLLRRLLGEFGWLDAEIDPSFGSDPQALQRWAGRLHKLKGSAGLLGATPLAALADAAETACRAHDAARAAAAIRAVSVRLEDLRVAAAAPTAGPEPAPRGDSDPAAAFDLPRLQELIAQLKAQRMSAFAGFNEIGAQLQHRLGAAAFDRLRERIDNLEFQEAAELLAQAAPALGMSE